jgi:hypothetical protein
MEIMFGGVDIMYLLMATGQNHITGGIGLKVIGGQKEGVMFGCREDGGNTPLSSDGLPGISMV